MFYQGKKIVRIVILWSIAGAIPLWAQEGRLQIGNLDKLAAKAEETVDIQIDGPLLQAAAKFLSEHKAGEAQARSLISGLKGIYVKSFEFAKEGEYLQEDVEAVRSQLSSPQWARVVGVRSKKSREEVDVFTRMEGGQTAGLVVLVAEPKELTVVNIVGPIDLEKLSNLEGLLGIPRMQLEKKSKAEKGNKTPEE